MKIVSGKSLLSNTNVNWHAKMYINDLSQALLKYSLNTLTERQSKGQYVKIAYGNWFV